MKAVKSIELRENLKKYCDEVYLSMIHQSYKEIQTGGFVTKSISEME